MTAFIERLRDNLLAAGRHRDATLVSVFAYAGLRPGEALALTWADVRENTILVNKALSVGGVKGTKTRQTRAVTMLPPLAEGLAAWRQMSVNGGAPEALDEILVFSNGTGSYLNLDNWRSRVYVPGARAAGLPTTAPYDLRHSFVSLLLAEGRNPIEVAQQAGHSPVLTLETYGHAIDELKARPRASAEDVIREARVAQTLPRADGR